MVPFYFQVLELLAQITLVTSVLACSLARTLDIFAIARMLGF